MPPATLGTVSGAVIARGNAKAPLEAGFERRRADFVVERERRSRRDDDAIQTLGRQLDVVLSFRATEPAKEVVPAIDQFGDSQATADRPTRLTGRPVETDRRHTV